MSNGDIKCCIIAGGRSGRFGSDKSLHVYNGKPLIQYVYDAAKPVFNEIAVIAPDTEKFSFLNAEVVPDLIPGLGPIGGIFTALESFNADRVFVFPCDMPFLNTELIRFMTAITGDYDIIVPLINGRYQPLHAIYSKKCADGIRRNIDHEDYRMSGFYNGYRIRAVTAEDIVRYGDPLKIFKNINFRDDLEDRQNPDNAG